MPIYAVIDTNVLVSALLSKNSDSSTVVIAKHIYDGNIIPLYNRDILKEYIEVLHRQKFGFAENDIQALLNAILSFGIEIFDTEDKYILIDEKDVPFYRVTMETRDNNSYLVTGNIKHFPSASFIVTPKEMNEIIFQETAFPKPFAFHSPE